MLTRRQLVRRGAAGAAVLLLPPATARAAVLRDGRFRQGVLSGDPTPDGITLLTLLDDAEGRGQVRLEVARDAAFRRVVASRNITTSARDGYSVKARIRGLDPHERYFYRFETRTTQSPVGRFQTALPEDSNETVKFAFFSCADYTHGYYNAYELMAREDVDFVVNLGDYIYAEAYHRRGQTGVRNDPIGEARSLDDYRDKYALYRSDKALRDVHAKFPMIATWDDHEVIDNYAGSAPAGGLPAGKYNTARKNAGYKAYFEAMPFFASGRSRIYRGLRFGNTVDMIMLDQRQYRDDQPCNDAVAVPCAGYDAPRAYLGRAQMDWVKQRLASSPAAWKVIGNETMMMNAELLGGAYYTFDSWQGYSNEREELLEHIRSRAIQDVVFVTGDIHTFIAGDVRTQRQRGESVALEFVGGSITSQSFGETDLPVGGGQTLPGNDANPNTPQAIIDTLRGLNPWVDQADFDHHGYGLVEASPTKFDVSFKRVQTIKRRSRATLPSTGFTYSVARGQKSIKGVNGPPA
ncbi:alkaline phosphatase D family protein [Solirubrobacter sp. CPCC 204708]|uniref:Alkaline phosphatase D family protein n=1 Tax=Solirubrobacter deserti TaxID=2282478 RepID=A0ABT4RKK6_9ACTN|nr:alkaline phosphatase D family protein [Solirubrobacter deserti]MBE2317359.1 alkaline phosphatase D family protein [Solirubrobacter deserti]MDA0139088.1 alkaline phosphatase D family protein [Solirubrobacter deserti]